MMTTVEYQLRVSEFAFYAKPVIVNETNHSKHFKQAKVQHKCDYVYPVMGLTEEAGEVAGKFAKIIRDKNGDITAKDKAEIEKELGDVMWMVAEICNCMGFKLHEVMEKNIKKLEDRRARNVLSGSGDNR